MNYKIYDQLPQEAKEIRIKVFMEEQGFKDVNYREKADFLDKIYDDVLADDEIKWNFTKFLINKEGQVVKRFEPYQEPSEMVEDIEMLLK